MCYLCKTIGVQKCPDCSVTICYNYAKGQRSHPYITGYGMIYCSKCGPEHEQDELYEEGEDDNSG